MKRDRKALELLYAPDEYLCTWSVPDGADGWRVLSGSVDAQANRQPRGQVYGDVPLRDSSETPGQTAFAFPQRTELPALRASLANGGTLILLDAEISYWGPGSGHVTGSAALLGKGSGFFGRTTGVVPATEQRAPLVTSARLQIAALDSILGTAPITSFSNPMVTNAPKHEWTVHTNPDAAAEWSSGGAKLRVGYASRMRAMDAFEFGLRFSPVATLNLASGMTLRELIDGYVEPLRRIITIATGRPRDLTYLSVELDGEQGWFQVFGTQVMQEPFESSSKAVYDVASAVRTHDDALSLLDLMARWRQLDSQHHPLIETYGSMLHAVDRHPRSRFLLLIQALEGTHGAETREEYGQREAKHVERRTAVMARVKDLTDGELTAEDRRFIKDNLQKKPFSGLNDALVAMAKALPVDGMDALGKTRLLQGLQASGRATSTSDALRQVRNDLAHGNRGYPVDELDEVVNVLEKIVRGHALRVLGCPDAVVARVFDQD